MHCISVWSSTLPHATRSVTSLFPITSVNLQSLLALVKDLPGGIILFLCPWTCICIAASHSMARGGRISASSSSGSSLCPLCLVPSAAALLTTRCVCVCVCVCVCECV